MSEQNATPINFTFPAVLERLDYSDRAKRRVLMIDAAETMRWYCQEWATLGMRYERNVQSAENQSDPDCVTELNVNNLANIRARGWSWDVLKPFVGQPLPELSRIPADASLFGSKNHDADAIRLVNRFCRLKGVKIANATKLLYQKRPGLIPIIDEYARRAFDLPWMEGDADDFSQVLKMAFWNLRDLERRNSDALNRLETWLAKNKDVLDGMRLPRLRIIDILGWSAIHRQG